MKLKYISVFAACLALFSFSSCNDFLDKVPDTRVELNTPEQLRLLLVDGYMKYNLSLPCELSTDNVVDNNSPAPNTGLRYNLPSYDRADDEAFAWEDTKSASGTDATSSIWEGCYGAIACANAVLDRIPYFESIGMADEVKAIKGEALLIRAFHHFTLANVFCMPYRGEELSKTLPGIPYITKSEDKVLVHYDRGNLADTYKMIQADLEAGLPLLDDGLYEVPKYHFNKAAANAFAARFYLFKREYDKVVKHADAAFGGQGVDPSPFMSDLWSTKDLYYLNDFGRYYTDIKHQRNFLLLATYSSFPRHFMGCRYACNRDAKRGSIEGPGPSWENCMYKNSQTKETFAMHPCFMSTTFTSGGAEYGSFFGGNCGEMFEYSDKVSGIGYAHIVRAEFTGEETLLCRAEAKIFLGDIDGAVADLVVWDKARQKNLSADDRMVPLTRELIKEFYSKPLGFGIAKPLHLDEVCPSDKYSITAENLPFVQCIQHFRRIETIHTGMRLFDIKRFGIEVTHVIGKDSRTENLKVLDPRLALQIPSEVISAGMDPNDRLGLLLQKPISNSEFSKGQYVQVN